MIKEITEDIKTILDIAEKTQNIELKNLIVDLKEKVLNLKEENLILKEKLSIQENFNMIFYNNVYYDEKPDGLKIGPYCTNCFDRDKKAIRLIDKVGTSNCLECPSCKTVIKKI